MTTPTQEEKNVSYMKRPTIVILGDWYIDENWLMSPQELYHSSATGNIHYLARHGDTGEPVTNLCAAAAVLETLKAYLSTELDDAPNFIAFGAWNPKDDGRFRRMLCPKNPEEKHLSPYTLSNFSGQSCEHCRDIPQQCEYSNVLINLAIAEESGTVSTNRIIRCFEGHGGAKPLQLYRFDWILPLNLPIERYDRISQEIASKNVVAIIIVDHGTGVVNEQSINGLLESVRGKDVRWFLRTKINNPSWLDLLRDKVTLEMNVSDYRLAVHLKGARRWWHGRHLGRSALEVLGEMTGSYTFEHGKRVEHNKVSARNAIVLLEDNTLFAMTSEENERYKCVSISQPPGPKQIINLGRTTIFSSALFAQRLRAILKDQRPTSPSKQLGWECSGALRCAYRWTKNVADKWSREKFSLYQDYDTALSGVDIYDRNIDVSGEYPWEEADYAEQWRLWNESSTGLGIVTPGQEAASNSEPQQILQLWRGEGVLTDYYCVGGRKRDSINYLVSAIERFQKSKNPAHSFCSLITSPPGWGKSFLARCLASHFDMEFLEFSIAQMCDNRDLVDCFATIASTQANTQRRALVFIDEVNADIEGHSVMGLLLSPLWGGTFVKDRQTLRLVPAVWVFASTSSAADLRTSDNKGSDFLSRLNGPIIEPDSPRDWTNAITKIREALHADANMSVEDYSNKIQGLPEYESYRIKDDTLRTEQVYLMVSLLNRRWGPISRVQHSVLELFRDLLPMNGYRSLEFFASSFDGIQRGEVRSNNVPDVVHSTELRRHVITPKEWRRDAPGPPHFVDIEIRIR